jgi:hypothetical protein
MSEDCFDEKEIGKGVTDRLIDESGSCLEGIESVILSGGLWFVRFDDG